MAHKFSLRTLPVYYLSVRDNGNMNSNGSVALQCKQVMEKCGDTDGGSCKGLL